MSFQTLRCVLCASEAMRQKVWSWTEKYTLLVNELLDQVATHGNFSEWQAQGSISRKEVEELLKPLKDSDSFKNMPGRFYTSAILMVQYTYLSWLALQKQRHFRIIGKQRWLEVLESDLEVASNTDFAWSTIRDKASEFLTQVLNPGVDDLEEPLKRQSKKEKETVKKHQESPLNALFTLFYQENDLLNRRAIAYLIRNNLQLGEKEESLDALLFRFEKKRIEIERLENQLKSRKPKGRDPLSIQFAESLETATALPEHRMSEKVEAEFNAWKTQKQIQLPNSLHYPVLFVGVTNLFWSIQSNEYSQGLSESSEEKPAKKKRQKKRQKKSSERICVNFNGFKKYSGEIPSIFQVQCDRRQLPILRQIVSDWQSHQQLGEEEKYGLGLMLLKSAQLLWEEDKQQLYKHNVKKQSALNETTSLEQPPAPWQTHRLYLHVCINPHLLTADGTEAVRQEKIAATVKKLNGLRKKKLELAEQLQAERSKPADAMAKVQRDCENRIIATATSLERLQHPSPLRPSKLTYQGQPNVIVGVSFSREKPVGVAVVDVQTGLIIEYQGTRLLLSNRTIKAKRGNRSVTQLRLEKYRLVHRRYRQQKQNSSRRAKEQKQNRYAQSKSESNLGLHLNRLIASRIVKLAVKWQASTIVIPNLGDIRESVEAALETKAKHKFPNELVRQHNYAKHIRSSFHTWSYGQLTRCIKSCAFGAGVPVEGGQQPLQGSLQEKALQVALHAYCMRQPSKK